MNVRKNEIRNLKDCSEFVQSYAFWREKLPAKRGGFVVAVHGLLKITLIAAKKKPPTKRGGFSRLKA